jgi:hypothetical protein
MIALAMASGGPLVPEPEAIANPAEVRILRMAGDAGQASGAGAGGPEFEPRDIRQIRAELLEDRFDRSRPR